MLLRASARPDEPEESSIELSKCINKNADLRVAKWLRNDDKYACPVEILLWQRKGVGRSSRATA
jgi:hypothetical protein